MVICNQYTRLLTVAFLAGLVLAPMVNMMLP